MTKLSNTSNTEPHLKPGVNSGAKGMISSTCSKQWHTSCYSNYSRNTWCL